MALNTSATINGVTYSQKQSFVARVSFTGKAASDGSGNNSTVTKGTTYTFLYYNAGASYPYAIGIPGGGTTVRCWVKATVFPYATYTIKYDANGGSGAPASQTKTYGTNLTLSSTKPTRTGYTFQGWATSKTGSVAYSAGGTYTANAAATLYAVWKINTYSVTYDANGGSGAPASQTKTYGTDLILSSTKPTRTGYTFKNWNTKADGTGTSYSAGGTYAANSAVTLYAQWTLITYTVSYNANGGSGAPAAQTKTYGVDLTLSSTNPSRTGYTFIGWSTSKDATSATYSAGGTYSTNASVTLYAVWKIITHTVTFNASANGGSGDTTKVVNYGENIDPLPTATRKYYVFVGWFTQKDGGTQITSSTIFTSDVTVYAHYIIDASVHVRINDTEIPGIPHAILNSEWSKGYSYVWKNGKWTQGLS